MPTPNHDYNTPEKGTQDWHQPLNNNFSMLDTDMEIRDLGQNLPDYEPKAGAKFFGTDTGSVFVGDGSQWNFVGQLPQQEIYVQSEEPTNAREGAIWIQV